MCNICGILATTDDFDLRQVALNMSWAGRHRGPDDDGLVEYPGIALAHRRLSIIDLTPAGHQPMADISGRYWIVFNGEIYNYIELHQELSAHGHAFQTRTDTEVILEAYKEWGKESLNRLNGMWAFAIWDSVAGQLFLARDRFGVKPLLYISRPGLFAFASEAKQLLAGLPGPWRLNRGVAADFFFWGFQGHTTSTFIEGVVELPGGHFLQLTRENVTEGRAIPRRYWKPEPATLSMGPEAVDRFGELFEDAVRLRLRSDVPLGVTLSGGLDSSSISCVASQLRTVGKNSEPIQAFTAVFDDPGYSEERFVQSVVQKAQLQSILIRPRSHQFVSDWPEFVRCMDEPFASLSFYANWKVYQQIREYGVPVVLNGQGGDELLLGYPRYRVSLLKFLLASGRLSDVAHEALLSGRRSGLSLPLLGTYLAYFHLTKLRIARRLHLLKPFATKEFFRLGQSRTGTILDGAAHENLPDLLYKEFGKYQLPHLLHHEDSVSMHFAIESRNPFLDYRLFEFVLGLGIDGFIHDGWSKYILRQAMRGIIPEEVRTRTDKMGYDTPTGRLLRDGRDYFCKVLDRNEDDPLLNTEALKRGLTHSGVNENVLCGALSYLSWKEQTGVSDL